MKLFLRSVCFIFLMSFCISAYHPVYVTVTEIEHNVKDKTLEISCKFFTDDLEKTLRQNYKEHIDLQDAGYTEAMNRLLAKYIPGHLKINADKKPLSLSYVGYQIIKGETYAFFETPVAANLKTINIYQDLLFEYQEQQLGIVHVTENGKTKSAKLQNPDAEASFNFPL